MSTLSYNRSLREFEKMDILGMAMTKVKVSKMKKAKKTVFMKKDLFPDNNIFDFSNDILSKKKYQHIFPDSLKKWNATDFVFYLKKEIPSGFIRNTAYDKNQILRMFDLITSNLINEQKTTSCDNDMMKTYINWWVNKYKNYWDEKNVKISTEFLCKENIIRDFVRTIENKTTLKPSELPSVEFPKATPTSIHENYLNGGISKILYNYGIVESYWHLINKEKYNSSVAIKSIKKSLISSHDEVFKYIVGKTAKLGPYQKEMQFDIDSIIEQVSIKKNIVLETGKLNGIFTGD